MNRYSKKWAVALCYVLLLFCTLITLYPLIYTLLTSFKTQTTMYDNLFGLPEKWHVENYIQLFSRLTIGKNIFNSFLVSVSAVAGQLIISCMAAYILTQFDLKHKKKLLTYFIIGMLIPVQVLMIPIAITAKFVGGYNSFLFLVGVYMGCGVPYMLFVISGFMRGIPKELVEAAMIDGCSGIKIFSRIVVPLTRPAIATMGMLAFIAAWNDLVMAMILLRSKAYQTVSLMLNSFAGDKFANFPGMCAAVIIAVLPTMVIYFIFQENIIEGMTAGSVKG